MHKHSRNIGIEAVLVNGKIPKISVSACQPVNGADAYHRAHEALK